MRYVPGMGKTPCCCQICTKPLYGKRWGTKTCTPKCRQALSRANRRLLAAKGRANPKGAPRGKKKTAG